MNSSLIAPDFKTHNPCLIELRLSKFNQVREFYIDCENQKLTIFLTTLMNDMVETKASILEALLNALKVSDQFQLELFDFYKEVLMFLNPNQGLVIDTENILCRCFGIKKNEVENIIANGAQDLLTVTNLTKAGGGCGSCISDIRPMLKGKSVESQVAAVTFLNEKKPLVASLSPVKFLKDKLFPFLETRQAIEVEGLIGHHLYVVGDESSPEASELKKFIAQEDENLSLFFI